MSEPRLRERLTLARDRQALREVFDSPDLRWLELAWFASWAAVWGSALILALHAYDVGGTGAVGLMAVFRTLPGAPVALFVTALADRHSRRSVLLVTNALRAAILGATAAAVATDAPLAAVYALAGLFAAAAPAYKPAQSALFPLLARTPSELSSANVAASILLNLGFLGGSIVAGVLAAATSLAAGLAFLAVVLLLSLVALARVRPDAPPERVDAARPLADAIEGFRAAAAPELRLVIALFGVIAFLDGAMDVFIIVLALDVLELGNAGAGYLNAVWGIGAIAGGAVSLVLLARESLTGGLVAGALVVGGSLALMGVAPELAAVVVGLAVFGLAWTLFEVFCDTLLQRLAPDHVLSRVFGVAESLYLSAAALGSLTAGVLSAAIALEAALVATGALLPAVVLLYRGRLSRYESGSRVSEREYGLLRGHRIFAPLPVATAERLARSLVEVRPPDGAAVIVEGDVGDRFYLIAEGRLDAYEGEQYRRTMGPGDGFGEIALLHARPRTATVRAHGDVVLLALDRAPFVEAVSGLAHSQRAARAVAEERLAKPA